MLFLYECGDKLNFLPFYPPLHIHLAVGHNAKKTESLKKFSLKRTNFAVI